MSTYRSIRRLDEALIGKIAAGEVVERPAFALKELIENSLDAGATAVTVEIQGGGIPYFRVTDNGCGIARPDLRMAFERHATSKIRTAEELTQVATLGFRGEALASIAAVSRTTLTTRTAGEVSGAKITCVGGIIEGVEDVASPEGTTIVVRDLFFNTPVRLKFLKKPATEAGQVSDMVMRMILSRPDIAFRFIADGKQVYHSPGDGDLRTAVYSVMGREVMRGMVEVSGGAAGCYVKGLVGVGDLARTTRMHQSFFLNGRYVRSPLLAQALEMGCRELTTIGHYPVCALHLTLPYEMADINVHPNKLEVRFQNEREIYDGLMQLVGDAFRATPPETPSLPIAPPSRDDARRTVPAQIHTQDAARVLSPSAALQVTEKPAASSPELTAKRIELPHTQRLSNPYDTKPATTLRDSAGTLYVPNAPLPNAYAPRGASTFATTQPAPASTPVDQPHSSALQGEQNAPPAEAHEQLVMEAASAVPQQQEPRARVVSVVFDTYILLEQGEVLFLIDQHAAHERILYDRLMAALAKGMAAQQLLPPMVVPVTHRERMLLESYAEAVRAAGFEVEEFGERTIQVRAMPMVLGAPQVMTFFEELLDSLEEYKDLPTMERRRDAIIQLSCKKAVKGGDKLSEQEIQTLLRDALREDTPRTCPHGRPICLRLTRTDLDKHFHRIQ